jgi:hypothetical protein
MPSAAVTALWLAIVAANPYLEEGAQLSAKLRYDLAEAKLQLATEFPGSTEAERERAYDLLARARAAQGNLAGCERAYRELLVKHPHAFAPSDASPKIQQAFLRAKRSLYPERRVTLAPAPARAGHVAVEIVDPWGAMESLVLVEIVDGDDRRERVLPVTRHRASAALTEGTKETVYRLEARGQGGVLATLGTTERPLRHARAPSIEAGLLAPSTPPSRPRAPAWTKWAVGALAVGTAVAGTAFAISSARHSAAADAATFASDTGALDRRAHGEAVAANVLVSGALLAGATSFALVVWW